MFAFIVFDLVFQNQAKRLAGKNVSEICIGRDVNFNSII